PIEPAESAFHSSRSRQFGQPRSSPNYRGHLPPLSRGFWSTIMNAPFRRRALAIWLVFLVWEVSVRLCRVSPRGVLLGQNVTACPHHGSEGGTATVDDGGKRNERPQWRPDDAAGAAGRDARAGHGAEGGGDPGGRARLPGPAGRRRTARRAVRPGL